jgi:hypothetical protein
MEQLEVTPTANGWDCSIKCAGPCYIACATLGPAGLAIGTGSFYYSNLA